MTEADLIVRDLRSPDGSATPGWWSAACKHCGTMLTKYDDTRESCVQMALALDHKCEATGQLGLL